MRYEANASPPRGVEFVAVREFDRTQRPDQ